MSDKELIEEGAEIIREVVAHFKDPEPEVHPSSIDIVEASEQFINMVREHDMDKGSYREYWTSKTKAECLQAAVEAALSVPCWSKDEQLKIVEAIEEALK